MRGNSTFSYEKQTAHEMTSCLFSPFFFFATHAYTYKHPQSSEPLLSILYKSLLYDCDYSGVSTFQQRGRISLYLFAYYHFFF